MVTHLALGSTEAGMMTVCQWACFMRILSTSAHVQIACMHDTCMAVAMQPTCSCCGLVLAPCTTSAGCQRDAPNGAAAECIRSQSGTQPLCRLSRCANSVMCSCHVALHVTMLQHGLLPNGTHARIPLGTPHMQATALIIRLANSVCWSCKAAAQQDAWQDA